MRTYSGSDGIPLKKILRMRKEVPLEWWQTIWQEFYLDVFKIKVDLSQVPVSERKPGFKWPVYVIPGLSQNQIYASCCEEFLCESIYGSDLDFEVPYEHRDPIKIGAYAKWFRGRVEPDSELKNKSANDLEVEGIAGNTFREALLLERFYFWCTGGHLNRGKDNLCAGSRARYGFVPFVRWCRDGFFWVGLCGPNKFNKNLRSRATV